MTRKKWPYPGDSPVARARKIALAYRAAAEEQRDALLKVAATLSNIDPRLLQYSDPELRAQVDGTQTLIASIITSVRDLDRQFREWGETWHADIPVHYEEDDYITPKEAAPLLNIAHESINRLRVAGRIKGKWDPTVGNRGGWTYRVGDIWKLSTQLRGRGRWRRTDTTDSISDDGRSDSK